MFVFQCFVQENGLTSDRRWCTLVSYGYSLGYSTITGVRVQRLEGGGAFALRPALDARRSTVIGAKNGLTSASRFGALSIMAIRWVFFENPIQLPVQGVLKGGTVGLSNRVVGTAGQAGSGTERRLSLVLRPVNGCLFSRVAKKVRQPFQADPTLQCQAGKPDVRHLAEVLRKRVFCTG